MNGVKCPKCRKIRDSDHVKRCFYCKDCNRWLTDEENHVGNCRVKDRKPKNPTPCPECKVIYNSAGLRRHRLTMHNIKVCMLIESGYIGMFFIDHDCTY